MLNKSMFIKPRNALEGDGQSSAQPSMLQVRPSIVMPCKVKSQVSP